MEIIQVVIPFALIIAVFILALWKGLPVWLKDILFLAAAAVFLTSGLTKPDPLRYHYFLHAGFTILLWLSSRSSLSMK